LFFSTRVPASSANSDISNSSRQQTLWFYYIFKTVKVPIKVFEYVIQLCLNSHKSKDLLFDVSINWQSHV
jgi:hypothetical protein